MLVADVGVARGAAQVGIGGADHTLTPLPAPVVVVLRGVLSFENFNCGADRRFGVVARRRSSSLIVAYVRGIAAITIQMKMASTSTEVVTA